MCLLRKFEGIIKRYTTKNHGLKVIKYGTTDSLILDINKFKRDPVIKDIIELIKQSDKKASDLKSDNRALEIENKLLKESIQLYAIYNL